MSSLVLSDFCNKSWSSYYPHEYYIILFYPSELLVLKSSSDKELQRLIVQRVWQLLQFIPSTFPFHYATCSHLKAQAAEKPSSHYYSLHRTLLVLLFGWFSLIIQIIVLSPLFLNFLYQRIFTHHFCHKAFLKQSAKSEVDSRHCT